ncbi:MAG TPA: phospholipase D-like domain-containing protein [Vicinamibacterales bacterium]|nr:phospholipase D-like domain-containing protein [Vicinamibacterales bacterium]
MAIRRRKLWITVAAVALVVTVGLLLAQDQESIHVQSAYAAEDPRFPAYVAAIAGSPLTRGGRFEVLTNGVQIMPAMLAAIEQAQQRIVFETYVFTDGEYARQFSAALARAAERGVRVYLLLDAMGAKGIGDANEKLMTDAGVSVAWFNPLTFRQIEEINGRTHRKILVVDGRIGFTGGVGVADHWAGNADAKDHWRDTQILVEGPPLRYLEACFYENWIESAGVVMPVIEELPDLRADVADHEILSVPVWSSPVGGHNGVKKLYLLSLGAARRTVDIQTPYFVMDGSTKWSLLQAAARGVRVRMLLEGELTDAKPVKYASRFGYEDLLAAGIEIYEYQPTMMHAKAMIVDGVWSIIGSSNLDNRSLELNDENNLGIADRAFAGRLLQDFEIDLTRSKRLTLEQWRERPWLHKVRERFWSAFGELF